MCYFLSITTPAAARALEQLRETHDVEVSIARVIAPQAEPQQCSVLHLVTHRGCSCSFVPNAKEGVAAEWQRRLRAALRLAVTRSAAEFGSVLIALGRNRHEALFPSRTADMHTRAAASWMSDEAWLVPGEFVEVFAGEAAARARPARSSTLRSHEHSPASRMQTASWGRN